MLDCAVRSPRSTNASGSVTETRSVARATSIKPPKMKGPPCRAVQLLRAQEVAAQLEQQVRVDAASQCNGRDRRAGYQALLDHVRLECPIMLAPGRPRDPCHCLHGVHHLLLMHTIKRAAFFISDAGQWQAARQ